MVVVVVVGGWCGQEPVYRMALKSVTANPKVALRLGDNLSPGKFRAYSVIEGGLRYGLE